MPKWSRQWVDSLNQERELERRKRELQAEQDDIYMRMECWEDMPSHLQEELEFRADTVEQELKRIEKQIEELQ